MLNSYSWMKHGYINTVHNLRLRSMTICPQKNTKFPNLKARGSLCCTQVVQKASVTDVAYFCILQTMTGTITRLHFYSSIG